MATVLNPDKWSHRLRGKMRLFWGRCPRCNSDAPAVRKCFVCKNQHKGGQTACTEYDSPIDWPPNRATKALWWYSWMHPGFAKMQKEVQDD